MTEVDVVVCIVDGVWVHKFSTASIFIVGDTVGALLVGFQIDEYTVVVDM